MGMKSNRDSIGTRIKLTSESGLVQYNHVTTAVSYASSNDPRVHFGLGADTVIKETALRHLDALFSVNFKRLGIHGFFETMFRRMAAMAQSDQVFFGVVT